MITQQARTPDDLDLDLDLDLDSNYLRNERLTPSSLDDGDADGYEELENFSKAKYELLQYVSLIRISAAGKALGSIPYPARDRFRSF